MAQSASPDVPPTPEVDPDIVPPPPPSSPPVDRVRVGELVTEEIPDPEVTTLTPAERLDLTNLMTIGRRTKKISVMDHPVTIRTLMSADEIRIGLHTKQYLETQAFARAYQVAVCACGIVDVDNVPLFQSLEIVDEQVIFDKNVDKLSNYYPLVIDRMYKAIRDLEREYADLLDKMGKLDG